MCNSIIHIDIGKRRNSNDEDVYEIQLRSFAEDQEYDSILSALSRRDYILAEQCSNRLKIKSYNLGMIRLAKKCDDLRLAILSGKDAPNFAEQVNDLTVVYGIMRECIDHAFFEQA